MLFLLSTTFNFNIITKFKSLNLITKIHIKGLNEKEKKILEKNLNVFLNKNIFFVKREEIDKRLQKSSFLDNYEVNKVFPSELFINVKKTKFLAKTILDLEEFYIGKNGNFTKSSLVKKEYNLPQVFGRFQINEFLKLQETLIKNGFELNNLKKYFYYKSKRWDIQNNMNITLMLPYRDLDKSLKYYKSFLKNNKISSNQIIDLRMPNKIIITNEER